MFLVDWESCDEEEVELDDTDKAKTRRYLLVTDSLVCCEATLSRVFTLVWQVREMSFPLRPP